MLVNPSLILLTGSLQVHDFTRAESRPATSRNSWVEISLSASLSRPSGGGGIGFAT